MPTMATDTTTRTARTDSQSKRVAKANRTTVTLPEVEQHIAQTVATYGSTSDLFAAHAEIEAKSRTTETGLRAWYPVALEAKAAGMTVRAFGEQTGGSKDTLSRLVRGALITAAFEAKRQRVSALMVQSVANRTTDKALPELLAEIKSGRTDLPTAKAKALPKAEDRAEGKAEGRQEGAAADKSATWSIKPSQYVSALEIMRAYLTALPTDKRGPEARRIHDAVMGLAQTVAAAAKADKA
jgi:hypothetical protein